MRRVAATASRWDTKRRGSGAGADFAAARSAIDVETRMRYASSIVRALASAEIGRDRLCRLVERRRDAAGIAREFAAEPCHDRSQKAFGERESDDAERRSRQRAAPARPS